MKYLAIGLLALTMACFNPFFFLPPFHEGPHRVQPTTQADIDRGLAVAACLEQWAQRNGTPSADYSDVNFAQLAIVRVGGDGVIGTRSDGATFQTDARESGDTIFVNEGVSASAFVGYERHELDHIVQQSHRELIRNGDIHYPPPFIACGIPLVIVR